VSHLIRPEDWSPIGVDDLEPAAFEVVRSTTHRSVIAGPGAGKTELLAQRACYLLQTGFCPPPRRILAISFKRDAAKNLKDRVAQRSYREHALRFDSLTFDAFAKGMLDRFFGALPEKWRPTTDYEILFTNYRTFPDFLNSLGGDARSIRQNTFEKRHVLGSPLPPTGIEVADVASWAAERWWETCLRASNKSNLTFPMIGRLVELLLRVNPLIRNALRVAYSHVFMDEFQDTTHVQYDMVRTAFWGSDAVLTAVGDNKQQIMRWAMALDDAFSDFENDFEAKRVPLIRNYRSSPALVRIQHHLALAVDPECRRARSMTSQEMAGDACMVLEFDTPQSEARYLAEIIVSGVNDDGLGPRDFALLVKQKPQTYEPLLVDAFKRHEIKIRVEADLQDLLVERLTDVLVAFLRFGARERAGMAWNDCFNLLAVLRGISPDDSLSGRALQRELGDFHSTLRQQMAHLPDSEAQVSDLLRTIVRFIGQDYVKLAYPEYRQGKWFETVLERTAKYLVKSCKASTNWDLTLDDFEGCDAVPIMTIHKSKGLEYHTVIFVGLDDSAWWSFPNQPEESRCAFFVAFSRAGQRVLFTYCETRGGRSKIASLYEILRSAGVKTQRVGDEQL
jgi:superfamily I DNA/RNA helicase